LHAGRVTRTRLLVGLAVAAAACGGTQRTPLPRAGSAEDDGAGQLAAVSSGRVVGGVDPFGPATEPRRAAFGGGGYGDDGYGGSLYGGALYGGYQPYGALVNPPAVPINSYRGVGVGNGGAITGTVRWPHPPSAPAVLHLAGCGDVPNPSLALGRGAAVGDAVVHLDKVARGRSIPMAGKVLQVGGQIERRGCVLSPPVQVATPVPSMLTVINADAGRVELEVSGARGGEVALDQGMRRTRPLLGGNVRVSDKSGGTTPAWVVSVPHPYYAMTDAEGRFRIDDIAPGTYDLVVWHAPVVTGVERGKVVAGAPIEVVQRVVVKADAATGVTVDLPAAK
jgi:Polysaccharide lyase family 4, domain II